MSNPDWPNHITITGPKRDPKPTGGSWWLEHDTPESLGAEARKRFPNATHGLEARGVELMFMKKNGNLG